MPLAVLYEAILSKTNIICIHTANRSRIKYVIDRGLTRGSFCDY